MHPFGCDFFPFQQPAFVTASAAAFIASVWKKNPDLVVGPVAKKNFFFAKCNVQFMCSQYGILRPLG